MKAKLHTRAILLLVTSLVLCSQVFALHNTVVQQARHRRSRRHRIAWNPVFRPSHESLLLQNEEVDRLELPRIQDDEELDELKASGALLPIVENQSLRFDPRLDPSRRFCRPWTLNFVNDLSVAFYKEFHSQIQVNSAVRTVVVQKKLRRHNRNAAPADGETASSHLAGITVDLQRRGMSRDQIKWMQQYMLPLKNLGLIEPEEERHQWVFHVMVSGRYDNWRQVNVLKDQQPQEESTIVTSADLEQLSTLAQQP